MTHFRVRHNRAAPLVCLLLLLVTTSNDEHGSSIRSGNTGSADSNTSRHTLLPTGRALLATTAAEGVVVGASSVSRSSITSARVTSTAVQSRAEDDVNGSVDLTSQVLDNATIHGVQPRLRELDILSKLLDAFGRIVH